MRLKSKHRRIQSRNCIWKYRFQNDHIFSGLNEPSLNTHIGSWEMKFQTQGNIVILFNLGKFEAYILPCVSLNQWHLQQIFAGNIDAISLTTISVKVTALIKE